MEKGTNAELFFTISGREYHRSGIKSEAFSKQDSNLETVYGGDTTVIPPGIYVLPTVIPSAGVTLRTPDGTGGWSLSASLMTPFKC